MSTTLPGSVGQVEISDDVLATVAGAAAVECYGLVGMASRKISEGIAEILGRDAISKGVQVTQDEGRLYIDLYIIVVYGVKITEVAYNVMDKVRYEVEKVSGLPVAEVNVNVQGVRVIPAT